MRVKLNIAIACALLLFLSCARQKAKPEKIQPNYKKIAVSADGCYGKCPIYSVEVDSSNVIRYFGARFTRHEGFYIGKFSNTAFQHLNKIMQHIDPDTLQKEYPMMVDAPYAKINFTTLQNNHICIHGTKFPKPIFQLLLFMEQNLASAALTFQKDSLHLELMPL